MASEKSPDIFSSEKAIEAIPQPAVAATPPPQVRGNVRRKILIAGVALVLIGYTLCCKVHEVLQSLAKQEAVWLGNVFHELDYRGTQFPEVPKHGKVPFGRLAEEYFLTIPNPASAIAASRQYATTPHLAGSPEDYKTALEFLALLQHELGISTPDAEPVFSAGTSDSRNATLSITSGTLTGPTAWVDVYYPVMNTPLDRSLEILDDDGNVVWSADLKEVADETDPEAHKYADAVPTWHGLSRDGEAQGKLVYAHYGRKQDYDALEALGVDLNGAVVIARYGGVFRGLKVKGAQERGAVACLIYSDPRDDGTVTQENGYEPYPDGPARNPTSVQRGSTQFLSIYPGDPTTPGYPSYENSTRTDGTNIPSIPSLPISWANANRLLKEIEDSGANRTVKLVNHVDDRVIPIWNTMGVIPGHIKNEVIVIGNHRDAWVLGATDPSSGTASIHEVIRGLGALLKKGWKPLRTIVIASWDAEEYGLIGSTEWGEDFAGWIDEHVVAYLNLDSSVSGSHFSASGSPSLAHFLRSAAEAVPHPTKPGLTLWDATKDRGPLYGSHVDAGALELQADQEMQFAADELGVGVLGSGSDYTVFLQRIGVASTNHGFASTLSDPVYHYHSVFDSQRWQELYADPGFLRHIAVAKFLGLQTLRLADAIVLPINTTHYAVQLQKYLDHVEDLASTASLDVDFSSLRESIDSLQSASESLDKEKLDAERELIHVVKRIVRRRFIRQHLREAWCRIRKVFGKPCEDREVIKVQAVEDKAPRRRHRQNDESEAVTGAVSENGVKKPRLGLAPARMRERREREHGVADASAPAHMCHASVHKDKVKVKGNEVEDRKAEWPHGPHRDIGKKLRKQLERAVKRVKAANAKLVVFERGFIHPDGIKDREWYRHLGVAPGKWLGYGATTLPALTEAITFEENATLAKYEAERLKGLLDQLTAEIQV